MASGAGSAEFRRQAAALFGGGVVAGLTDGELLDRFASRSGGGGEADLAAAEAAFGAIVARHGPMVLGVCRRALRDDHDAEDAFQATFLVLARRAGSVRVDDSLGRWLYGVSRRVASRARSRAAKRRSREATGPIDPDRIGAEAPDDIERADLLAVVLDELGRLPEPFREAVALCDLEGCTVEEAARRLGRSPGTVKSRVSRGRARLRDRLSRRGLAPGSPVVIAPTVVPSPTAALRSATTRAAVAFASRGLAAGAVPAGAATLAEGALLAMLLTKTSLLAACAAVATLAALSAGTIAHRPDDPTDPPVAIAIATALPPADEPEADPPAPVESPPRVVSSVRTVPKPGMPPEARPAFEVLVVDEETGGPIPNATVRAQLGPGIRWVTTDADGVARGLRPSSVQYDVTIDAWAEAHQSRRAWWSNAPGSGRQPLENRVTIALRRGELTVGGRVVDEVGDPIPGVTVELQGMREGQNALAFYDLAARTDSGGQWSSRSMPADLSRLTARYYHPDYVSPVVYVDEVQTVFDLDALKAKTHVMTLHRGVRVVGRVLNGDGHPIAGATLKLPARVGMSNEPEAETDAEGRFVFPAAFQRPEQDRTNRNGSFSLMTVADGFTPDLRRLTATADLGPLEIRLEPGRTIRGRAVYPSGNPIPDALLIARTWRDIAYEEILALTDAEGRFSWDSAPPDAITLELSRQGYRGEPIVCTPGETEYTWTLTPTLSVELSVTDARTGTPIRRFELVRGRVDEDGGIAWEEPRSPRDLDIQFYGRGFATLDASAHGWVVRILAQGYRPLETRTIARDEGRVMFQLEVEPLDFGEGGGPSGVVVDEGGNPLQGAEVMLATRSQGATLQGSSWWLSQGSLDRNGAGTVVTDAEGRFTFLPTDEPYALGVVHELGYGESAREKFEQTRRIVVRPWGRVEGRVLVGDRPKSNMRVVLSDDDPPMRLVTLNAIQSTTTGPDGGFRFDRVKPGPKDADVTGGEIRGNLRAYVTIEPGEAVNITLGGTGRPVVGRLRLPEGLGDGRFSGGDPVVVSNSPDGRILYRIPYPDGQSHEEQIAWLADWWWSTEGLATRQGAVSRGAAIGPDGRFRVEDVPPGSFTLRATVKHAAEGESETAFSAEHRFEVGPIPGGRSIEPIDLGVIRLEPAAEEPAPGPKGPAVGEPAPDFEAETIGGGPLRLADYRGKFVLLDFWATWCGPCIAEFPHLKAAADLLAEGDRGVLISLSLDDDREALADFLASRDDLPGGVPGYLGPWSGNPVAGSYGVTAVPTILLVGPDGTVLARGLRGTAIAATLRGVLARP